MKITKDYLKKLIKEEIEREKTTNSLNGFFRILSEFLSRLDTIDDDRNIFEDWDDMNNPETTTSEMFDNVSRELRKFTKDDNIDD